ncbi:MAG: acyltransferase family protein [Pseudomonadota bacterium]
MNEAHPFRAFRPDIEGMRAIAVLLVVVYHAGFVWTPGGFIGVDIFFAISGYLITGLLIAESETAGRISLAQFYARRGRRLLPAAFLMISVTIIASHFIYGPYEKLQTTKFAASASLYVSNIFFAMQSDDYFSAAMQNNPFLHTWSLAVEEQFYLVWPLLIVALIAMLKSRVNLISALLIFTVVSFSLCIVLTIVSPAWAFYSLPTRAWEFSVGGLARLAIADASRISMSVRKVGTCIAMAIIAASAILITEDYVFPGWWAAIPVLAATAILTLGGVDGPLHKLLGNSIIQWIGTRSYAIYLWHWPALRLTDLWFGELTPLLAFLAITGCLIIAHLSYELVENPIRRGRWISRTTMASLASSAALTIGGAGVAFAGFLGAKLQMNDPYQQELIFDWKFGDDGINPDCFNWPHSVTDVWVCEFGDEASERKVALLGDSHARHWARPLQQLAEENSFKLRTFLKGSCPIADVDMFSNWLKRSFIECNIWRDQAIAQIINEKPMHVIIGMFSYGQLPRLMPPIDEPSLVHWANGVEHTIRRLQEAGIRVIFIRQLPVLQLNAPDCLSRVIMAGRDTSVCNVSRADAFNTDLREFETEVLSKFDDIAVMDFTEHFCDEDTCYASRDSNVLYRDEHHVSVKFSITLKDEFSELLN